MTKKTEPKEAEVGEINVPIVTYREPSKRDRALQYALQFYSNPQYEVPEVRKEDHTAYTPAERLVREAKVLEAYLYPEED